MMSKEDVELVRAGWEAFNRGDFDAVAASLDPEVEWRAVEEGPWDCHGREEVLSAAQQRFADAFVYDLEDVIDAGDKVVVSIAARDPQGLDEEWDFAQVVTIRDGKIIHVQDYEAKDQALEAARLKAG